MAVVIIVLGCTLGSIAGLFQFVFLGASFGQAVLTYAALSLVLPVMVIGATRIVSGLRPAEGSNGPAEMTAAPFGRDEIETWQDWQTEEEMEAHRRLVSPRQGVDSVVSCHSDSSTILTATRPSAATACSARRAGKE